MDNFTPGMIVDVAVAAGCEIVRHGTGVEVRIRCPQADHHRNGDRRPSCRLNPEKNTFYCDPCGHGGGVKELSALLGVDMLAATGAAKCRASRGRSAKLPMIFEDRGPVSDAAQKYFSDHLGKRYALETWVAFKVREGVVHPEGQPNKTEKAIAFPQPGGGYHFYRFQRPDKKRRWGFSKGAKHDFLTVGFDRPDPVLLCEGEWDAMRGYEAGFSVATGTGGAGAFNLEWARGSSGRAVVAVYDIDEAGLRGAEKALQLVASCAASTLHLKLPLSGDLDRDGKDLSDYLAVHSTEELRTLIAKAQEAA